MPATIIASGRLTKDAETRQAGNSQVVSFSVAVNCYEKREKVTRFYDCSWFGGRAIAAVGMLTKGSVVSVTGAHSTREHGGKVYEQIDAWNVELLGGRGAPKQDAPKQKQGGGFDGPEYDAPTDDQSFPF